MGNINTNLVFKQLKKQNGEAVAKVIREAVLLDVPDIVHILEFAGKDPDEVRQLVPVINEIYKTKTVSEYQSNLDPIELLNLAGYDAFVVKNEKQKNSIAKYYRPNEEICTLRDPSRHENFYMIHAIKKNADKIKPAAKPERDDEYGTSVISIQIAKKGGFISIKNRYNHTVDNPDATFDNNPDNIIPGLSGSLKKYFNVDFNTHKSALPNHYRFVNDQLVRFNYEINNVYFGANCYFVGSNITRLKPENEFMFDCFILDTKNNKFINPSETDDTSFYVLKNMISDKKIQVKNNPNNKNEKMFYADGEHIATIADGQIVELNITNPEIKEAGTYFLRFNTGLRKLNWPALETCHDYFLFHNLSLKSLSFPRLTNVGKAFLSRNETIEEINFPLLREIGDGFASSNKRLTSLSLPELTKTGSSFLRYNESISYAYLPKLKSVGGGFLDCNTSLTAIDFPELTEIDGDFIGCNKSITSVNMPKLTKINGAFLSRNTVLTDISLPELTDVTGNNFLLYNRVVVHVFLPKLRRVSNDFLPNAEKLKSLSLPELVEADDCFLEYARSLENLSAPKLRTVGDRFCSGCDSMASVFFSELESIGYDFFSNNTKIKNVYLPKLKSVGDDFLRRIQGVQTLDVPDGVLSDEIMQRLLKPLSKKELFFGAINKIKAKAMQIFEPNEKDYM